MIIIKKTPLLLNLGGLVFFVIKLNILYISKCFYKNTQIFHFYVFVSSFFLTLNKILKIFFIKFDGLYTTIFINFILPFIFN